MTKKSKGFSLLELLVVISIIGVLTSIGALSFTAAQKRARDSVRREHMQEMQDAMEQYFLINNSYIDAESEIESALVTEGYLKGVPSDPKKNDTINYIFTFDYDGTTDDTYCFCAQLETVGAGRNTDNTCGTSGASNDYYCVSNLQ